MKNHGIGSPVPWFFYIGGNMPQYKNFRVTVDLSAYDSYTPADVEESIWNLLNGFGSLLNPAHVKAEEL